MLSKEKIEKAKEKVKPLSIGDFVTWFTTDGIVEMEIATETLLQYIQELEISNAELDKENNRLEKIEFERDMLKKGQASLMSSRKKWQDRYYKLRKIFNKQSKIIDEMAKEINKAYYDEDNFWLWFEKDIINETSNLPERIIKIKQHFKEKVEEK